MPRFRKKPLEIEAIQWTGDNEAELFGFAEIDFYPYDEHQREIDGFTAEVYDRLHKTWIKVKTGDWILKGIQGEFYPCEEAVFAITYEAV